MAYDKVLVDLQNKPQEFVDLYALANPLPGARAKVPLLQLDAPNDDNQPIMLTESMVVAEYIAEQYGRDCLLPSTAKDRATMRLFTELCGSSFSYFPLLRAKGPQLEAAVQTFKDGLVAANAFLKHYQSGPFLMGQQFSLAECVTAPFVQRACTLLPALTGRDEESAVVVNPLDICDELGLHHLQQWMQAVLARSSVVATSVPKDEMVQSATKMLERFAAMQK